MEDIGSSSSFSERGMRPKKPKIGEKKVPQRGLGVAQLEKLRMEEQFLHHGDLQRNPNPHPYVVKSLLLQNHQSPQALLESSTTPSVPAVAGLTFVGSLPRSFIQSPCLANDAVMSPRQQQQHFSFWLPADDSQPAELPLMNLASCNMMQSEPPSNQSHPANSFMQEENATPKRKKLSLFPQDDTVQSKVTRLDPLDTDSFTAFRNEQLSSQGSAKSKPQWQTSLTLTSASNINSPDFNLSYDSGCHFIPKASSSQPPLAKDSCSSTGPMQLPFQLNHKGLNENAISSNDNEPCDFLTLGSSTPVNGQSAGKFREHSSVSEKHSVNFDGHEKHGSSPAFPQDASTKIASPVTYQFEGLLKLGSNSEINNECIVASYGFQCHDLKDKDGGKGSVYRAGGVKHADLDLRLSL